MKRLLWEEKATRDLISACWISFHRNILLLSKKQTNKPTRHTRTKKIKMLRKTYFLPALNSLATYVQPVEAVSLYFDCTRYKHYEIIPIPCCWITVWWYEISTQWNQIQFSDTKKLIYVRLFFTYSRSEVRTSIFLLHNFDMKKVMVDNSLRTISQYFTFFLNSTINEFIYIYLTWAIEKEIQIPQFTEIRTGCVLSLSSFVFPNHTHTFTKAYSC